MDKLLKDYLMKKDPERFDMGISMDDEVMKTPTMPTDAEYMEKVVSDREAAASKFDERSIGPGGHMVAGLQGFLDSDRSYDDIIAGKKEAQAKDRAAALEPFDRKKIDLEEQLKAAKERFGFDQQKTEAERKGKLFDQGQLDREALKSADSPISRSAQATVKKFAPRFADMVEGMSAEQIAIQLPWIKDAIEMEFKKDTAARLAESKEEQARIAASLKPTKITEFDKTMDHKQADTYQAALDSLPKIKNRIDTLDKAFEVIKKVETGPFAGKEYAFFAQKLNNEDAQLLEHLLSTEGVQLIMEFAKEAGARAVDTAAEQERLLNSIANERLDVKTLRAVLNRMKNVMTQSRGMVNAKKTHYLKNGNLRTFDPEKHMPNFAGASYEPAKTLKPLEEMTEAEVDAEMARRAKGG